MIQADEFMNLVRTRRSIRRYTEHAPSRQQIESLIEAACWAPSSHNRQGWKFIVFESRQEISTLAERVRQSVRGLLAKVDGMAHEHANELIYYSGAFEAAPVIILVMHKRSPAVGQKLLSLMDHRAVSGDVLSAAMATQNLLLAAHAQGLGACIMAAPLLAGEIWASLSDLPAGFEPTCVVTLGFPAEQPAAPRRKNLKHVIEYR